MLIPSKRQMREINECCLGMSKSLAFYQNQAAQLGLIKTCKAIGEAAKICGWEVNEARDKFDNSGRRR